MAKYRHVNFAGLEFLLSSKEVGEVRRKSLDDCRVESETKKELPYTTNLNRIYQRNLYEKIISKGGKKVAHNTETMIAGIRNLLITNYGYDGDEVDVEALVDPTLTFGENWNAIKLKYVEREMDVVENV